MIQQNNVISWQHVNSWNESNVTDGGKRVSHAMLMSAASVTKKANDEKRDEVLL